MDHEWQRVTIRKIYGRHTQPLQPYFKIRYEISVNGDEFYPIPSYNVPDSFRDDLGPAYDAKTTYKHFYRKRTRDLGWIYTSEDPHKKEDPHEDNLKFAELREANISRLATTAKYKSCSSWTASDWSNALAGEVGETCNLAKKMLIGEKIPLKDIADELADVVIYADLLANKLGIELGSAVRAKFNRVSTRVSSNVFLSTKLDK